MGHDLDMTGQWALITGASAGIGQALARAFAGHGANIIAVARRKEKLEELASRLATRVEVIATDLGTKQGVEWLFEEVERRGLVVSHLVNDAGVGGAGAFAQQNPDEQVAMTELNCTALLRLTRHFLPNMIERNDGGVIQLASVASYFPTPYMAVYGATKAYVLSLSSALAEELKGTKVRMLAVCPGSVPTEFQARAGYRLGGTEAPLQLTAEQVARATLRAYARGKHVVVPGRRNALNTFLSRFASVELRARAAGVALKRAGRDKVGS